MKKIAVMTVLGCLAFSAAAFAQGGDVGRNMEDYKGECRKLAQEQKIAGDKLDAYLKDCEAQKIEEMNHKMPGDTKKKI